MLYDTEDIAPSKKASKKCEVFKNTQRNQLTKAATKRNGCCISKNLGEGVTKEFLKLDIHCTVTTAILHNSAPQNATVLVPEVGNSPRFPGVNFISRSMTPIMPHHKSY